MARIAGINIPQNKVLNIALTYIHGIGLHSSNKICDKLNMIGLEVEDVFDPSEIYKDFTICEISSIKKHMKRCLTEI